MCTSSSLESSSSLTILESFDSLLLGAESSDSSAMMVIVSGGILSCDCDESALGGDS
jgi:hypothetical protein